MPKDYGKYGRVESLAELYSGDYQWLVTGAEAEDEGSSKNKGRLPPSSGCGIARVNNDGTVGVVYIEEVEMEDTVDNWREGKDDIMSYMIRNLELNGNNNKFKQRIHNEFRAEASIKASISSDGGNSRLLLFRNNKSLVVNRADHFLEKQMSYGSWSFSNLVIDLAMDHCYPFPKQVIINYAMVAPSSLKYLIFPCVTHERMHKKKKKGSAMGGSQRTVSIKEAQSTLDDMVKLIKLMQQAMYKWDGKRFAVNMGDVIFKVFPNADKTMLDKTKTTSVVGLHHNELVKMLAKHDKSSVTALVARYYDKYDLKWTEQTADVQQKERDKQSAMIIMNPVVISEGKFRQTVRSMCDEVYGEDSTYESRDTFKFTNKKLFLGGDSSDDHWKKLSTALCLLQLGIGSRALGVMAINKIEKIDNVGSKEGDWVTKKTMVDDEDSSIRRTGIAINSMAVNTRMRVSNITKEKDKGLQVYKRLQRQKKFISVEMKGDDNDDVGGDDDDEIDIDAKVRMEERVEQESENVVIDKPLQSYLFNPSTDAKDSGDAKSDDEDTVSLVDTRVLYIQLLKAVRDIMVYISEKGLQVSARNWVTLNKTKFPRLGWETYENAGRVIPMVKKEFYRDQGMQPFVKYVYQKFKYWSAYWQRKIGTPNHGTHEWRRLYVCYSYEFFGRGTTKEIGYAQYVLRHKSITSSVFYTSMSFSMTLGSGLKIEQKKYLEHLETLTKTKNYLEALELRIEDGYNRLKRVIDEANGTMPMRKKLKATVDLKKIRIDPDSNEEIVVTAAYEKKKREDHGVSRAVMIDNGIKEANKMKALGFIVTRTSITKAGVNSTIAGDVMARL